MTPKEFNELPICEQAITLWGQGKFIEMNNEHGKCKIGIYLLFDSVVSVKYDIATNTITKIQMWDSVKDKTEVIKDIAFN